MLVLSVLPYLLCTAKDRLPSAIYQVQVAILGNDEAGYQVCVSITRQIDVNETQVYMLSAILLICGIGTGVFFTRVLWRIIYTTLLGVQGYMHLYSLLVSNKHMVVVCM